MSAKSAIESNDDEAEYEKEHYDQFEDSNMENPSDNVFKIKNTKGSVVYDKKTKQKRYMSPFDQFLSEQQELFKKESN